MDQIIVFIVYGGKWDANNKYVDHQVKIIMVHEGITYTSLIEKISKELGLDPTIHSIKMSFDTKIGTNRGMTIENDDNVAVFLYLVKNDPEFKRCSLVVEFEESSQTMTKSKTASNQTTSTVKEKEISVVNEETEMYDKSNSSNGFPLKESGSSNISTASMTTAEPFSSGTPSVLGSSSSSLSETYLVSSSNSSTPIVFGSNSNTFSCGATSISSTPSSNSYSFTFRPSTAFASSSSSLSQTDLVSSSNSSTPIVLGSNSNTFSCGATSISSTPSSNSYSFTFRPSTAFASSSSPLCQTNLVSSSNSSTPIVFGSNSKTFSCGATSISSTPSSNSYSFTFRPFTGFGSSSSSLSQNNLVSSSSSSTLFGSLTAEGGGFSLSNGVSTSYRKFVKVNTKQRKK